jgi:stage II sporulation protein D
MTVIRKTISVLFTTLIMAFFTLVFVSGPHPMPPSRPPVEPPAQTQPSEDPLPPLDSLIPAGVREDNGEMILVLDGEEIVEMSMERFLIGSTAAEMPSSFDKEALKAQAVAIRTNIFYNMLVQPKERHPDAHVCTNYSCCMAFYSDESLRETWGEFYIVNVSRIINAVVDTDGLYMTYEGQPIFAAFHSSSAGKTDSSGNVWLVDIPYLVSVDTPETAQQVTDYVMTREIPGDEFKHTVVEVFPDAAFGDDPAEWIKDVTYNDSGRVSQLAIGGEMVRGTVLRAMFGLRSTAFTIDISDGNVIVTTTGYGHGVGMSQYGAHTLALGGKTFDEILVWYYTDTEMADRSTRSDE